MKILSIASRAMKVGDIIQFVQDLFNLSFKEAMQKINEDFNLGLDSNTKINYKKIKEIEEKRNKNMKKREKNQKLYNNLCMESQKNYNEIEKINKKIKINNWENLVYKMSELQMKNEIINEKLDRIDQILSRR